MDDKPVNAAGSPQAVEGDLPAQQPRKRRRWAGLVLLVVLLCGAALWALPWVVGATRLKTTVTYAVLPWLPPGAKFESPSLGWTAPVHLSNIELRDSQGRLLFECDHVTSRKSLWSMALSPRSPGGWDLEQPHLTIHVDPSGTNIDSMLRRLFSQPRRVGGLLDLAVTLTGGQIDVRDDQERTLGVLEDISLDYANTPQSGHFNSSGSLTQPPGGGAMSIEGTWTTPADARAVPTIHIQGNLDRWPAEPFATVIAAHSSIQDVKGQWNALLKADVTPASKGATPIRAELRFEPTDVRFRRAGNPGEETLPRHPVVANVSGAWDSDADLIDGVQLNLQSDFLELQGSGTVRQPRKAGLVDLSGDLNYDLTPQLDRLSPEMRRHILVVGPRLTRWAVRGALDPAQAENPVDPLALAGDVTWDSAKLFDLEARSGTVTVVWSGPQVDLIPRDVSVGGGRLTALPQLRLEDSPTLIASPGPVLDGMELNQEQCRGWLRFLSPIMADATSAEGRFTLALDQGRIPLSHPQDAEISGKLHLHDGRIGPGPLAAHILDKAASVARLITRRDPAWAHREIRIDLPEQDVPFRVDQGAVTHEGLRFRVGDLEITSHGVVNLDESLALTFDIPLPAAWLSAAPILQSMQGEVVSVLVGGTLTHPQVDEKSLLELGKRIGGMAAGGMLQKLLESRHQRAAEKAGRAE